MRIEAMDYREGAAIELQTGRLVLRTIDSSFAARSLDYFVRNRVFFKAWMPTADDTFYTLAFHEEKLQIERDLLNQDRSIRLWIFKKEDRDFKRIIGDLAFSNIIRGAFQSCHLGYKMDGSEINKGLMTEALKRAIQFAFDELRLHRIEANIMPKNVRSIKVVEKLGFVNEGVSRKYLNISGVWQDHSHYVLLNPDEGQ
jgi:ribosomal-protein-alanine N-acetyltransferase